MFHKRNVVIRVESGNTKLFDSYMQYLLIHFYNNIMCFYTQEKYKERLFIHNFVRSIRGGRNIRTIKKTQRSEVVGLTLSDNNLNVYQFFESELKADIAIIKNSR